MPLLHYNVWMLFVTVRFDHILPASSFRLISPQNQKQRKGIMPKEPDEFPKHWVGGYSGWSLALFSEKYLNT